jgi:hypothetical protein
MSRVRSTDRHGRDPRALDCPTGLACPACSSLQVFTGGSRRNYPGGIWRRARCHSCGHKWSTVEIPIERALPQRIPWVMPLIAHLHYAIRLWSSGARAKDGVGEESFADLLRQYRLRAGMNINRLAVMTNNDRSYLVRLEHGERAAPGRQRVLDIARALSLSAMERDRLLVAAGYAPEILVGIGWTAELHETASLVMAARFAS